MGRRKGRSSSAPVSIEPALQLPSSTACLVMFIVITIIKDYYYSFPPIFLLLHSPQPRACYTNHGGLEEDEANRESLIK